jgi:hypothetical protein
MGREGGSTVSKAEISIIRAKVADIESEEQQLVKYTLYAQHWARI